MRSLVTMVLGLVCLTSVVAIFRLTSSSPSKAPLTEKVSLTKPVAIQTPTPPTPRLTVPDSLHALPIPKSDKRLIAAFHCPGQVRSLDLSADEKTLVTFKAGRLEIHDARKGLPIFGVANDAGSEWAEYGDALKISPKGDLIAGALVVRNRGESDATKFRILNAHTGKLIRDFTTTETDSGGLRTIAFSGDGQLLAVCGSFGVQVWKLSSGESLWHEPAWSQGILGIAFSPDSRSLAGAGWGERSDKSAMIWNSRSGKLLQRLSGSYSVDCPLVFSPDGRTLATTGFPPGYKFIQAKEAVSESYAIGQYDFVVMLWNVKNGKLRRVIREKPLPHHNTGVYAPIGFIDNKTLIIANNGQVDIRNLSSGKVEALQTGEVVSNGGQKRVVLSRSRKLLLTSGKDSLQFWKVR